MNKKIKKELKMYFFQQTKLLIELITKLSNQTTKILNKRKLIKMIYFVN